MAEKMKNRSLAVMNDSIPYCKGLRPYAKSVAGCLLMQQLDYWFSSHPDGFYKFLEPCPNSPHYAEGDSWTEELGMSVAEFRTAFDDIGIRYRSKTAFEVSADKFQGAYYCSYFDKQKGLTFYFRNHKLMDDLLDKINQQPDKITTKKRRREMQNVHLPEMQNQHPCKSTNSISVDAECESIEMHNVHPPYLSTETTAEITTETTAEECVSTNNVPPGAQPTADATDLRSHTQQPQTVSSSRVPAQPPPTQTGVLAPDKQALLDAALDLTGKRTKYKMGQVSATWTKSLSTLLSMLEADKRTPADVIAVKDKWPQFLNNPAAQPMSVEQAIDKFDAVFNFAPKEKTNGAINGSRRNERDASARIDRMFAERLGVTAVRSAP